MSNESQVRTFVAAFDSATVVKCNKILVCIHHLTSLGWSMNGFLGGEKEDVVAPREKTEETLRMEAEEEALSKQLTLDEFKAQMAARRAEPHFNIRQAGEGTNDKDFGKLVPLTKPVMEEISEEEIVVVVYFFFCYSDTLPMLLVNLAYA